MNLAALSITSLRSMLTAGETTPREIVESIATAISAQNDQIGGYLSADLDRALVEAEASDLSKPLGGIPIALKDNINVLDQPCTCASSFLKDAYLSPYDATVSVKLKQAGAVLYGRTNLDLPPRTLPFSSPAILTITTAFPGAPQVVPRQQWPPRWQSQPWVPIPGAPCANLPVTAGSSD